MIMISICSITTHKFTKTFPIQILKSYLHYLVITAQIANDLFGDTSTCLFLDNSDNLGNIIFESVINLFILVIIAISFNLIKLIMLYS